jgi:hypothetical protein
MSTLNSWKRVACTAAKCLPCRLDMTSIAVGAQEALIISMFAAQVASGHA